MATLPPNCRPSPEEEEQTEPVEYAGRAVAALAAQTFGTLECPIQNRKSEI